MDDCIVIGDTVSVFWKDMECEYNCEVVYIPGQPGEHWRVKRIDGTLLYIDGFQKMEKLPPKGKPLLKDL
jgi:hypothetical protein